MLETKKNKGMHEGVPVASRERGDTRRPKAATTSSGVAADLSPVAEAPESSLSACSLSHFVRFVPSTASSASTSTTTCLGRTAMQCPEARSTS